MFDKVVHFIRDTYQSNEFIPLHAPTFSKNEKAYVCATIDSTLVSSIGSFVDDFETAIESFIHCQKAIATVNGSAALHTALYMANIKTDDLVITQSLTFVATCNALFHLGAKPIFIDISRKSLGLCPIATEQWLSENAILNNDNICIHKKSGKTIKAVLPMHTFGHPVELDEFIDICQRWSLTLIEDAAESLGSLYKNQHTGIFGEFSCLSFNGNKIITTGGGGMLVCKSKEAGQKAKHITTTSKVPHSYEYYHDEPGFNYRLPNINAALGCAQMESLPDIIFKKRLLATHYKEFFNNSSLQFFSEPNYARSNYWLNAVICPSNQMRQTLLEETNKQGIMTRPVWQLMHKLPMFKESLKGNLSISEWAEAHIINIPSSPPANMETQ